MRAENHLILVYTALVKELMPLLGAAAPTAEEVAEEVAKHLAKAQEKACDIFWWIQEYSPHPKTADVSPDFPLADLDRNPSVLYEPDEAAKWAVGEVCAGFGEGNGTLEQLRNICASETGGKMLVDILLESLLKEFAKEVCDEAWMEAKLLMHGPLKWDSDAPTVGADLSTKEATAATIATNKWRIVKTNFTTENLLVKAVKLAFYEHLPLRLGPDVLWFTILQGISTHIEQQGPDEFREVLGIQHEGKKTLKVIMDKDFTLETSTVSDWVRVAFPEIANGIKANCGEDIGRLIDETKFSTTTVHTQVSLLFAIPAFILCLFFSPLKSWGCASL
jgi:hypothetical protein